MNLRIIKYYIPLILVIITLAIYLQEVNDNLLTEQIINAAMEHALM